MQYNSHATGQDIVSEINALCDSDATTYPIADKTRRVNTAYQELVGEIITQDGTWQFDDTNYTDLPRGKMTLVEGQEDYEFASEYLSIDAIEILNKAGTQYQRIKPLDHHELGGVSPQEYFGTDSSGNPSKGFPEFFDVVGDTIFLYPAPTSTSMTLTNGLRIWFKRNVDLFTTTDNTQEPGLPSPYHVILAYMAAIPYCMTYKKDRVAFYEQKVEQLKKGLFALYGRRERYKTKRMTMAPISFR